MRWYTLIRIFMPKMYVRSFKDLSLDKLKERGIKVLICDIDNTLAPHDMESPSTEVIKFIKEAKAMGFQVAVASNNHKSRVSKFCEDLDIFYINSAKKPLPFVYMKMAKHFQVDRREMAMFGDQLLTDMLGANTMGVYTILTSPLVLRDIPITKFNRKIEKKIYEVLDKKELLRKGDYFD